MSRGIMQRGQTPECCDGCRHLDWSDDASGRDVSYCLRGLIFPTKKQACTVRNKPAPADQQRSD